MATELTRRAGDVRPPALLLTVVAAVVLVGERVVGAAIERVVHGDGEFPFGLPELGSVGETAVFYATSFDVLTFVVLPVVLVWFGYALGRRHSS